LSDPKLVFAVLSIASILLVNFPSSLAQEFDSTSLGFGMPDISISPVSGPPGTEITITIKNMPPVPEGQDPRIEFFAYIPFVTALGSNVANNCNGEHCFPVYSFEEIADDKLAPKTIKFALFSTDNPKATVQGGFQQSVCDVKINEKTIERYGTVCTDKDQPLGNYEIKFAWGIQGSDAFDVRKTLTFTVTEKGTQIVEKQADPDEIILQQYQDGEITEEEFEKALRDLGYDDEGIRKAKALLGKLPHQQGQYAPEQKEAIIEGIEKAEQQAKEQREATQENEEITAGPTDTDVKEKEIQDVDDKKEETKSAQKSGCLVATAAFGSELASQVQMLREIRDNVLFGTGSGTAFMAGFNEFYYSFSPAVADLERQNPIFKEMVKYTMTPMLSTLSILNYVDIDSEQQMLGYGIGIILLNVGMYFVAPAIVIIKIRKYFKV
jgi:hypothetical protein